MRRLQIGVMGSAADLKYGKGTRLAAERVGELIAKKGGILVFGAEKDYDSLSTAACRGAKKANGITVGITYGKGKDIYQKEGVDVIIPTGLERGGGREFVLSLTCDAIIAIGGGSGTLAEIAIAYQANIPIVALAAYGGWSEKLAGTYIDARKRVKILRANTPDEAVELAIKAARSGKS
ncbi:MAG: TIGR00725 family protein [Candidatus Micrarchaeia archaeon]